MASTSEAVSGFLQHYGAALGAGDIASISRCWDVPALVIADEGVRAVTAAVEIEVFFAAAVEWYRSQGFVATRPEATQIQPLGPRLVCVDVRWASLDATGVEASSERSRYVLRQDDEGRLRIRVAISVAES